MYFIQIGKVEMLEFTTITNVDENDGYVWIEASECDDSKEIQIYMIYE